MNNLSYKIQFDAKNNVTVTFSEIKRSISAITGEAKKASGQFSKLTDICASLKNMNFSAVLSSAKNFAESISSISDSGSQFEQNLANLSSITGLIGDDLQYIADKAKETGKASGLGAAGAVDAFALLASQIQIDKIGIMKICVIWNDFSIYHKTL